jgi:hypothetical protein
LEINALEAAGLMREQKCTPFVPASADQALSKRFASIAATASAPWSASSNDASAVPRRERVKNHVNDRRKFSHRDAQQMPSLALWKGSEGNGMRLPSRKGLRTFSVGVFVALIVGVAHAIPFHYSESVSGDLAGVPSTDLSFGIGNNTISGSTHLAVNITGPGPHFDTDFDSFAFSLPAGSQLVDLSIAFTTISSNTVSAYAETRLCLGVGYCAIADTLGYQTVSFFDVPPLQVDFGGALPLITGTYTLFTSGLGIGPVIDPSFSESWSADYEWTLSVIPVPEPELLPLLGLGLAGLAFIRRRKQ